MLDDLHVRVHFGIVDNLSVQLLVGKAIINIFVETFSLIATLHLPYSVSPSGNYSRTQVTIESTSYVTN